MICPRRGDCKPLKTLIINEPPCETERMYSVLRLACELVEGESHQTTVFLTGDWVSGAKVGQRPPDGYHCVERMLHRAPNAKAEVLLHGNRLDACAITDAEPPADTRRSTMDELVAADKLVVF